MAPLRLGVLFALTGCGSLVDDRFNGVEFLRLDGEVLDNPTRASDTTMRLALFYYGGDLPRGPVDPKSLIEDERTSISISNKQHLSWSIYDLPRDRHFITTPSGKRWAVAAPYAYQDTNGDRTWSAGEPIIGESPVLAIVHAPDLISIGESPGGQPLDVPGLRVGGRPIRCDDHPPEPEARSECGVPIGATCESNDMCGTGGTCLQASPYPWPGGACALSVDAGCAPARAHRWKNHRDGAEYWLNACESDRDCRETPFRCDVISKVCLPIAALIVRTDGSRLITCQGPGGAPPGP